jgi:hypothetical protein
MGRGSARMLSINLGWKRSTRAKRKRAKKKGKKTYKKVVFIAIKGRVNRVRRLNPKKVATVFSIKTTATDSVAR